MAKRILITGGAGCLQSGGFEELAAWLEGQAATDHVAAARRELVERGLTL